MSRNLEPKGKIVRRLGVNIFGNPKFDRLLERRPTPPGDAKKHRPRVSEYGKQLSEKQKLRYMYGLFERQFRHTFRKALRRRGVGRTESATCGSGGTRDAAVPGLAADRTQR